MAQIRQSKPDYGLGFEDDFSRCSLFARKRSGARPTQSWFRAETTECSFRAQAPLFKKGARFLGRGQTPDQKRFMTGDAVPRPPCLSPTAKPARLTLRQGAKPICERVVPNPGSRVLPDVTAETSVYSCFYHRGAHAQHKRFMTGDAVPRPPCLSPAPSPIFKLPAFHKLTNTDFFAAWSPPGLSAAPALSV